VYIFSKNHPRPFENHFSPKSNMCSRRAPKISLGFLHEENYNFSGKISEFLGKKYRKRTKKNLPVYIMPSVEHGSCIG